MRNRYFAHIVEKQGALCDHLDFTSTFFILLLRLGFTITFICWSNLSSNILVIERLSKTIKNYAYKGQYFRDQFFVPKFAEQSKQCKTNDLPWLCMAFRNQILMYKNLSPWTLRCAELACVCFFMIQWMFPASDTNQITTRKGGELIRDRGLNKFWPLKTGIITRGTMVKKYSQPLWYKWNLKKNLIESCQFYFHLVFVTQIYFHL